MSTEQREGSQTGDCLSENVMESMSVQENDGTYHVSIPKDAAQSLGLEKGTQVLITGEQGARSLRLRPCVAVLGDD
ncbi:AbrB/MazE/SpoVT family DNA-binding domain-containing protein [Halorussus marinus]|uniref:AbrB/MazE/SpoVT family DNA-binding domain-containing protein n=1 Tax=Halorussus marinus TaxID=2505976 RepID=UPI00106EB7BD|nr:AbrB/MazE/SpoVT family DNA-binding domain-containing protein [Halorussus marinus]